MLTQNFTQFSQSKANIFVSRLISKLQFSDALICLIYRAGNKHVFCIAYIPVIYDQYVPEMVADAEPVL